MKRHSNRNQRRCTAAATLIVPLLLSWFALFSQDSRSQDHLRWSKDYIYLNTRLLATVGGGFRAYLPHVPVGAFNTMIGTQNISAATSACSFSLYGGAGNVVYTSPSSTLPARSSLFVNTSSIGSLASGNYSGVVSCNQPAHVVSFFRKTESAAAYGGVAGGASIWYAPGIYNNYYSFYTNIVVQNTSSSNADISVSIYAEGNPVAVATQTAGNVAPNASASLDQRGLSGVNANIAHSAVIRGFQAGTSAPAAVAAIVVINSNNQLFSYTAFANGGTTWYTPANMVHYYGWNSALVIQNVGTAATSVTVTYSTGESQTKASLAANSSWSIYLPAQSPLGNHPASENVLAGATITSTSQPIVVQVNESNSQNRAATYTGLLGGGTAVYGPLVSYQASGYDASITCQNLGTLTTDMTLEYVGVKTITKTGILPGNINVWVTQMDGLTLGFQGAVVVTSTNSQPIGCIINMANNGASNGLDTLAAYETKSP
jgi:hypothetical protein